MIKYAVLTVLAAAGAAVLAAILLEVAITTELEAKVEFDYSRN